ncbi:MAG: AAA family ATPase, partial [Campylobacter sp.]|nr:AAA family ATPase [Campylobacter sp.]
GKVIYALDTGALIAGTTLRGMFEERAKAAIDWLKNQDNAIVFIDEIHTIMGLGDSEGGASDLASIIKPALANGEISCIGATTYAEFRKFEKDKALMRRFSKVDVPEPSVEDSVEILKGIAKKYEEFHAVKFSDEVLHEAVVLAKRYISDKFLPDSAIDLIDETGASFWIKNEKRVEVSKDDLLNTLGEIANISNLAQNDDNETTLLNLENNLKKEIFGQDEAVGSLCKALFRSYAGLKNDTSPIGVFLFTGSSGVGKTELAKVLAKNLGVYFDRYDMSEYMEEYSVSKLIGSAPGYVGFENGGILTNSVRKHPYSVILFDEIEKANQKLMNIFLGIFDNATLSDNTGQSADFKNTIIIMTSNLGTKEAPQIGFQKDESYKIDNAVKSFFAPEFRNRLDKIINFNPLNNEILEKIVDKSVSELENKLENITINLSKNAKEFLIKKGYSAEFGARNLKRVINSEISDNLSSEILFGKLKNGGVVNIDVVNENLNFEFQSANLNFQDKNSQISNLKNSNEKFENFKMKK